MRYKSRTWTVLTCVNIIRCPRAFRRMLTSADHYTVSISDFRRNLYFGRRFILVTTTNETTLFRLAMRLGKNFIVTLKKTWITNIYDLFWEIFPPKNCQNSRTAEKTRTIHKGWNWGKKMLLCEWKLHKFGLQTLQ